jgi:hypothetical protein
VEAGSRSLITEHSYTSKKAHTKIDSPSIVLLIATSKGTKKKWEMIDAREFMKHGCPMTGPPNCPFAAHLKEPQGNREETRKEAIRGIYK